MPPWKATIVTYLAVLLAGVMVVLHEEARVALAGAGGGGGGGQTGGFFVLSHVRVDGVVLHTVVETVSFTCEEV
jgi:hypothetical protein